MGFIPAEDSLEDFTDCADITVVGELDKDLAAYKAALPSLVADAGKFALFYQEKHIGTYETYSQALTKGYEVAGVKTFLVQQISQLPQMLHFSRALKFECPTSS